MSVEHFFFLHHDKPSNLVTNVILEDTVTVQASGLLEVGYTIILDIYIYIVLLFSDSLSFIAAKRGHILQYYS